MGRHSPTARRSRGRGLRAGERTDASLPGDESEVSLAPGDGASVDANPGVLLPTGRSPAKVAAWPILILVCSGARLLLDAGTSGASGPAPAPSSAPATTPTAPKDPATTANATAPRPRSPSSTSRNPRSQRDQLMLSGIGSWPGPARKRLMAMTTSRRAVASSVIVRALAIELRGWHRRRAGAD
jgi:hypothetical protein